MKKKNIAAVAKASTLLACAPMMLASGPAPIADVAEVTTDYGLNVEEGKTVEYNRVANVTGEFSFDQNVVTPSDKVFSLFGTAATAMCATPGYAFGDAAYEDYYVTVNGGMEKAYTISLDEMREQETRSIMKCSCSTSGSVANAQIVGVPLESLINMDDIDESINTVTVRGSDGYGKALPLKLAVEKGAMLVYNVGGEGLRPENGGPVQLWMPGVVASYFTRQVTEIELTAEAETPALEIAAPDQRAKINILNQIGDATFKAGDLLTFEGYADDCGSVVAAVEFSMDGGETWTACSTEGATADKWVYWYFGYVPEEAGTYKLEVRARTADDTVSPLSSSVVFTVE